MVKTNKFIILTLFVLLFISGLTLRTYNKNKIITENITSLTYENSIMKQELDSIKNIIDVYNVKFIKEKKLSSIVFDSESPSAFNLIDTYKEGNFSKTKYASIKKQLLELVKDTKTIPSIKPLLNCDVVKITSEYGYRLHPIRKKLIKHDGIDFSVKVGKPVISTADGIILDVLYDDEGYGNRIIVQHNEKIKTLYAHLDKIKVRKGQKVKMGDIIGLSGNTGLSSGPHLHYEIIIDNKNVNPAAFYYDDLLN